MQEDAVTALTNLGNLAVLVPSTTMLFPSDEDKTYLVPRGYVLNAFITALPSLRLVFGPLGDIAVVVYRGDVTVEDIFGSHDARSVTTGVSGHTNWTVYNRVVEENAKSYIQRLVHGDN